MVRFDSNHFVSRVSKGNREKSHACIKLQNMVGRAPGLLDHFIDKRSQKESIGLKKGVRRNAKFHSVDVENRLTGRSNGPISKDEARHDFGRAESVNFARSPRVNTWDEMVQLGNKRSAFLYRSVYEPQLVFKDMECRSQAVVSVRSRDSFDLAIPVEPG